MTPFLPPPESDWGMWPGYLGVGNDTNSAKAIMGYILEGRNSDKWRLGDTFHSNPIVFGSPSGNFIDFFSPDSFSTFRTLHQSREKIVVVGANDGQFRAFSVSNGDEKWSFIPPNLLPKLQYLALPSGSTTPNPHMYFVDGPVTGADVWWSEGDPNADGTNKLFSDWKTMLVFSEGRGVRDKDNNQAIYLWNASQDCDGNFNYKYDSSHPYYCGYWAFDVTDTSATTPALKWTIKPTATQALYLDEPWSKMAIGRVKIGGKEKWVGFIGAGYNHDGDLYRGKGFFVVDLSNGNILWSFTRGASDTSKTSTSMTFSIPASPAIVDTDNDGFVDTAYIGDLGGNIWRFKFCSQEDYSKNSNCGTGSWKGGRLFQSASVTPIFTIPSVARDSYGYTWVFWGTGDKENPTPTTTQDIFFAIKDSDFKSTYALAQLQNISSSMFTPTKSGWYINLPKGEKVLADSATFAGMITWTTYAPPAGSGTGCGVSGTAQLYALAMMPIAIDGVTYEVGAGLFQYTTGKVVGKRTPDNPLGAGIAQVPIYSQRPVQKDQKPGGTDVYISISDGGAGSAPSIVTSANMEGSPFKDHLQAAVPSNQILHWRDIRMR